MFMRLSALIFTLLATLQVAAAPLCSGLFFHLPTDPYSDINHRGALDKVFFLQNDFLFQSKWVPRPVMRPRDSNILSLSQIHFMQGKVSNNYTDAHTVVENARQLRDGTLKPSDLPAIRVWEDTSGRIWTLDHRRLAAFILSGKVQKVAVKWASKEEVQKESYKMTTMDDGETLVVAVRNGPGLIIERPLSRESILANESQLHDLLMQVPDVKEAGLLAQKASGLSVEGVLPRRNWLRVEDRGNRFQPNLMAQNAKAPSTVLVQEILYSRHAIRDASVLEVAQRIRKDSSLVSVLPSLRVWQDSLGRVWTEDNSLLAAYRLAGVRGQIKVQWLDSAEAKQPASNVDTQVAGKSVVIELVEHHVGLIAP